jgi:hypothetical protein
MPRDHDDELKREIQTHLYDTLCAIWQTAETDTSVTHIRALARELNRHASFTCGGATRDFAVLTEIFCVDQEPPMPLKGQPLPFVSIVLPCAAAVCSAIYREELR